VFDNIVSLIDESIVQNYFVIIFIVTRSKSYMINYALSAPNHIMYPLILLDIVTMVTFSLHYIHNSKVVL